MHFVSRSEIVVPLTEKEALEAAFRDRARKVDAHAGFLGLELHRDIRDNGRYVLLTRWQSRAHFVEYMKSGDHARAHAREHAGLSAPHPGSGGKLEQFDVVVEERPREPTEP